MPWLLLDLALGVLAFLVLGSVAFGLYRKVRVLMRTVGQAGAQVDEALAGIHDAQDAVRGEPLPTA